MEVVVARKLENAATARAFMKIRPSARSRRADRPELGDSGCHDRDIPVNNSIKASVAKEHHDTRPVLR
jgi:hypothetical protein